MGAGRLKSAILVYCAPPGPPGLYTSATNPRQTGNLPGFVDNHATPKHPKVRTWLGQRPRFHLHYTPTYSSWLNQVERWFGLITQQAIRRGSFSSVKDLVQKIDRFVQHYNRNHRPLFGPPPPIPSSKRSHDFVHVSPGHDASPSSSRLVTNLG